MELRRKGIENIVNLPLDLSVKSRKPVGRRRVGCQKSLVNGTKPEHANDRERSGSGTNVALVVFTEGAGSQLLLVLLGRWGFVFGLRLVGDVGELPLQRIHLLLGIIILDLQSAQCLP